MKKQIVGLFVGMMLASLVVLAGTTSTHYSLYKPAINETGWGGNMNNNTDTIDSLLYNSTTSVNGSLVNVANFVDTPDIAVTATGSNVGMALASGVASNIGLGVTAYGWGNHGNAGYQSYLSAGMIVAPSFTDNGNGTVTVGNQDVVLYDNSTFQGVPKKYTLMGLTNQALTDNATNYIVGDYNGGSPIMRVITNVALITESDIVPIYTVFRNGNSLHIANWDALGVGLANKVHQSIVKTQRYRRESGLALSETGTRNMVLTSGVVWTGAARQDLSAIASLTDNAFLVYHSGGNWTVSTVTSYNNTQYDNGTDLATLTANRYAVNWIYRGVESQKHLYIVLGTGDYTETQAVAETVPVIPPLVSSHAVLVGKIIVQKSADTSYSISSAFDTPLSYAQVTSHNNLSGIDGGETGYYGHLTSTQATGNWGSANLVTLGNIGAGTTAPTTSLQVVGTVTASELIIDSNAVNLSDTTDEYVLAFDTGTQTWRGVEATGGAGSWTVSGNDQYASTSGNVGIGSTAPAVKLDVAGRIAGTGYSKGQSKQVCVSIPYPASAYALNTRLFLNGNTGVARTVTDLYVTLDTDPTTEINANWKYADSCIGLANATVINDLDTTAGVRYDDSITQATIPAGKCEYIESDAAPDSSTTMMMFCRTETNS